MYPIDITHMNSNVHINIKEYNTYVTTNCCFVVEWYTYLFYKTLGTFIKSLFGWFKLISAQTFQPLILIFNKGNIIGDVHQFIVNCLIP